MELRQHGLIRVDGRWRLTLVEAGKIIDVREGHNLLTTAGKQAIVKAANRVAMADRADFLNEYQRPDDFWPIYGALGSGTTAPAVGDTKLQTEVARIIVADGAGAGGAWTWSFLFGIQPQGVTINEIGVFVHATSAQDAGTLLDHALLPNGMFKAATNTLLLEFTFTLTGA